MNDAVQIVSYSGETDAPFERLLQAVGWEQQYITGQIDSIHAFAGRPEHCAIYLAKQGDSIYGFITVEFYRWNRLAQIHGLIVDPQQRRQGIAARLVTQAEEFAFSRGARGVYVDTPVTNAPARTFYETVGYRQDYIMTSYYDDGLDGVTYLKFFQELLGGK